MSQNLRERAAAGLFAAAAAVAVFAAALICVFLVGGGMPAFKAIGPKDFLMGTSWRPTEGIFGILPMIVGSFYVTAGALLLGVPAGLASAIFLSRFASPWQRKYFGAAVELLAGIPSVVYGFWGLTTIVPLIRVCFGGSGSSLLAAAILLGIMILPTIASVATASLDAVPQNYYEGAIALGATHEHAVFTVIVRAARSGLLAGVILGLGRAVGEAMAVLMVAGNRASMPRGLLRGVRTLTSNIVLEMGYAADLHRDALIATGLVLFLIVLAINLLFSFVKRRII